MGRIVPRPGPDRRTGFTLVEVMFAVAILATALTALVSAALTALHESEVNRDFKLAIFDTKSIVEQIAGTPFNEICNASYAAASGTVPRFTQGALNLATTLGATASQPHLSNERITVSYFPNAARQSSHTILTAAELNAPPDPLWITVTTSWTTSGMTMSYALPFMVTNTLNTVQNGSGP